MRNYEFLSKINEYEEGHNFINSNFDLRSLEKNIQARVQNVIKRGRKGPPLWPRNIWEDIIKAEKVFSVPD
jgi:hypothetical protein